MERSQVSETGAHQEQFKISRRATQLSWVIALLITLKSVYLAFFVIPPADIPDESGHYAYVRDIARGSIFPLLTQATIPGDLWMDLEPDPKAEPRMNYIVQHPPLYYAVAAVPYVITSQLTNDRWYLIRMTRLVSAISLGLILVVVFRTLTDTGMDPARSLLASTSIAFIPTLSNLSAGITNDAFLFLICALATRYLVRFVLHHHLRDAYLCALWLTAAGATKMTAWIMIAGFVGVMLFELRQPLWRWILHGAGISLLALLAPLWWMGRNLLYFGNPFFIGIDSSMVPMMPGVTIWQFLETQPFFYFMLVHFYALFGFSGYCQTPELIHLCQGTQITHVNNEPFFFFLLVLAFVILLVLAHSLRRATELIGERPTVSRAPSLQGWVHNRMTSRTIRGTLVTLAVGAGLVLFAFGMQGLHNEPGIVNGPVVNALAMAPWLIIPFSLLALTLESNPRERLTHHLILVFALFCVIFVLQAHKAYVLVAQMRGVQGRYFFPYIPMLLAAGSIALMRWRVPVKIFLWVALGLALSEVYTYVQHVIPFFETVKI